MELTTRRPTPQRPARATPGRSSLCKARRMEDRLLTPEEVADMFGVTVARVHELRKRQGWPHAARVAETAYTVEEAAQLKRVSPALIKRAIRSTGEADERGRRMPVLRAKLVGRGY